MLSDLVLRYLQLESEKAVKKQQLHDLQEELNSVSASMKEVEREIFKVISDHTYLVEVDGQSYAVQKSRSGEFLLVLLHREG